jgi:hypothetical protein
VFARVRVHGEVQKLRGALGIVNPVGELALQGYRLKVARDLVEQQVGVHACGGNDHNLGIVFQVKKS